MSLERGEKRGVCNTREAGLSNPRKRARNHHLLLPTWRDASEFECGDLPRGRAGHNLVALSDHLYLFGGYSNKELDKHAGLPLDAEHLQDTATTRIYHNSIYQYDCMEDRWTLVSPTTSQEKLAQGEEVSRPQPRRHASMVAHGDSLYVFGGFDRWHRVLGDFWRFSLKTRTWACLNNFSWEESPPLTLGAENEDETDHRQQEAPTPRAEHTAVVYKNWMIIFGGYDGKKKLNDTYLFCFSSHTWSRHASTELTAPSRRCKHAAVLYKAKMYVLGGFQFIDGQNFAQTDLHALDCNSFTWSSVKLRGTIPEALQGHKAVVCDDSMFVLGGKVRWESSTSELNQDLWQYRFDSNLWSPVSFAGTAPNPRQLHAVAAIPGDEWRWSIYLYGGTDKEKAQCYKDICVLENLPGPLHADMRSLLNNESFADVVFLVEGRKIYAHRCILVARSEYFRSMFKSHMMEQRAHEIPIEEVSYDVFLSILEFAYTDRVELSGDLTIDLLKAAGRFGLEGLREKCEENFSQMITVENAAHVCDIADQHEASNLRDICISYIVQNFLGVLETDGFQDMISSLERRPIVNAILQRLASGPAASQVSKRRRLNID